MSRRSQEILLATIFDVTDERVRSKSHTTDPDAPANCYALLQVVLVKCSVSFRCRSEITPSALLANR